MKILMLCDFYNESLTYQENLLAKYYVMHGHEVVVVASTFDDLFKFIHDQYDPAWPERDYTAAGARIIKLRYRTNYLNRVRTFASLRSLLDRERPDLVFVHDIHLNLPDAVAYVRSHPAARLIMDYHADYTNSAKNWLSLKVLHGLIRKRVLDMARPYISKIFPVVPGSATFLRDVYHVRDVEMELLPLGVDLEVAKAVRATCARQELRHRYGISSDAVVVFSGGKLDPLKQTDALIQAFLLVKHPDLHLVLVGDAPPEHAEYGLSLRDLAANNHRVRFTGWLNTNDVLEHMLMSDFAVFPASQSVMWQQSISMGLPVVIGNRTTVARGDQDVSYLNLRDNVHIVDGASPMVPQLVSAISRLASDRVLCQTMAQGADYTAANLLDWNSLVHRTLAVLPHYRDTSTPKENLSAG